MTGQFATTTFLGTLMRRRDGMWTVCEGTLKNGGGLGCIVGSGT